MTVTPSAARDAGIHLSQDGAKRHALALLAIAGATHEAVARLWPEIGRMDRGLLDQLVTEARYAPYAERQGRDIAAMRREQGLSLPSEIDYGALPGLSAEIAGKLSTVRPTDLAQAARIDGMTPAALTLLLAHARRQPRAVAP